MFFFRAESFNTKPARHVRLGLTALESRLAPATLPDLLYPTIGNSIHTYTGHLAQYAIDINQDRFKGDDGAMVLAAHDGYAWWVVNNQTNSNEGYGNYVIVTQFADGTGDRTLYGHLDPVAEGLEQGDPVRQGQIIGFVGTTGDSTADHLHFEYTSGGARINLSNTNPDAPYFFKGILVPTDRPLINFTVHPELISPHEQTILVQPGQPVRLNMQGFDSNEAVGIELLDQAGNILQGWTQPTRTDVNLPTQLDINVPNEPGNYYVRAIEQNIDPVSQFIPVTVNRRNTAVPLILTTDTQKPNIQVSSLSSGPFAPGNTIQVSWTTSDNYGVDHVGVYLFEGNNPVSTLHYGGGEDGLLGIVSSGNSFQWTIPNNFRLDRLPTNFDNFSLRLIAWDLANNTRDVRSTTFRLNVPVNVVKQFAFNESTFNFPKGQAFSIGGRLLNQNGQPIVGEQIYAHDNITQSSRLIGATNSSGQFTASYTAGQISRTGMFPISFFSQDGSIRETVMVSINDANLTRIDLERLHSGPVNLSVTGGPIGRPQQLDLFTSALSDGDGMEGLPLPSWDDVKRFGQQLMDVVTEGWTKGRDDFYGNPVNRQALYLAAVSCPIPEPTVTKLVCAPALGYASASAITSFMFGTLHAGIDQWVPTNYQSDLHNIVDGLETLISVVRLKLGKGIKNAGDMLEVLDAGYSVITTGYKFIKDIYGQVVGLQVEGKRSDNSEVVLLSAQRPLSTAPPPPAQRPDLAVTQVNTVASATVGGNLDVGIEIRNLGTAAINPFTVDVFLSKERAVNASAIKLTPTALSRPGLPAGGGSGLWTPTLALATTIEPGNYYVVVRANTPNGVTETSVLNNIRSTTGTIHVAQPAIEIARGFQFPVGNEYIGANVAHHFGTDSVDTAGVLRRGNLGTNFAVPRGTMVKAAAGGEVVFAGQSGPEMGGVVVIKHPTTTWGWTKDVYILYGFVEPLVRQGDMVNRGVNVAKVGTPPIGEATPSLRFEVRSGTDGPSYFKRLFLGQSFSRLTKSTVNDPNGYQLTWHDPHAFILANRFAAPPAASQIDLDPFAVSMPGRATIGTTIPVYTHVDNLWPAASGSYTVRYVFSTDQNITLRDTTLTTITRPSLAGNSSQKWTEMVPLPGSLAAGTGYIGVLVDNANAITEVNESNNDQSAAAPVILAAAGGTKPDLLGTSLRLAPRLSGYPWGQTGTLEFTMRNAGVASAAASTVRFEIVDHPTAPTLTYSLGTKTVPALAANTSSNGQFAFALPALAPSSYVAGPLYIRMLADATNVIDEADETNNSGRGAGTDYVAVPLPAANTKPDLVGAQLTGPGANVYKWGERVVLEYTVENRGAANATNVRVDFYLSRDAAFGADDYRLHSYTFAMVAAGQKAKVRLPVTLPGTAPSGLPDGPLFIGAVVDPDRLINETNEANNRSAGLGADYVAITIVPPPPTASGPEPSIGNFTIDQPNIVRGQVVNLFATGVLDDQTAVGDLIFRIDANGNGVFETSDPLVGYGSRNGYDSQGYNFSLRVQTNASWPLGTVTLLARATDNHGLHSPVRSLAVQVAGNAGGPFPDDDSENNDTEATATRLSGGSYHQRLNRALTLNDPDYYSFDVLGSVSRIVVRLNFVQEAFQGAGVPVGDLAVELRRFGSNGSMGFSNNSVAGTTSELIDLSAGSGASYSDARFIIIVSGGQANERNSNYTLTVQLTPVAGAPIAGPLVPSVITLVQGEPLTLTMDDAAITGIPASEVDSMSVYADLNNDGQLQTDTEYLGTDWGPGGEGPNGDYQVQTVTTNWPHGAIPLIAIVARRNGPASLAEYATINVLPNNPATIAALNVPSTAIQGGTATLTATNVTDTDPNATIVRVRYHLDSNDNRVFDGDDLYLGDGTRSGTDWSRTVPTADWPLGDLMVFSVATDNLGLDSIPAVNTLTLLASDNQRPTIGALLGTEFLYKGTPLLLTATNVVDPNNDTLTVRFYDDANGNFVLDAGDTFLGFGTQAGTTWTATVTTTGFNQGGHRLFVEVTDNGTPAYTATASLDVTVADITGARGTSVSPASAIGSLSTIRVTFDEPVEPATFTLADIASFVGPGGNVTATAVDLVAGSNQTQFDIAFDRQTNTGLYTLVIGPNILDLAGNLMNQDGDATNGEATQDQVMLTFELKPSPAEFVWGKVVGGSNGSVLPFGMTSDTTGNFYLTGQFSGTIDFDPDGDTTTLTANGTDIFVAKYTSTMDLLWVRGLGGSSSSEVGEEVAVDAANNVYVTGYFSGTATFSQGGSSITSAGPNNAFLMKLNSTGSLTWLRSFGGNTQVLARDLVVNANGAYVTGSFSGTADFAGIARTSSGSLDSFIIRYDASGTRQWVNTYGNTNYDVGQALAQDSAGNIYAGGIVNAPVTFGSSTVSDGFGYLLKLDSNGNVLWVRAVGGAVEKVAVTTSGDIFVTGDFASNVDFDPGSATLNLPYLGGTGDIFVSKFASDGMFRWAGNAGGSSGDRGYGIAVDSAGNVYVSGDVQGTADFDPSTNVANIVGRGGYEAVVFKWSSAGAYVWAREISSIGTDRSYDLIVAPSGAVYVSGFFDKQALGDPSGAVPLTLDGISTDSAGQWDIFVAQAIEPPPNAPPVINAVADQTIGEGNTLSVTVTAADPESSAITFSVAAGSPAGVSIHPTTGVLTWTPTESQGPGVYNITVHATDNGWPTSSTGSRIVKVNVTEVNVAPVLAAVANRIVYEETPLVFAATANDADLPANTLTYSLAVGAPPGASIDATTGVFTWTPTETQGPGTYTLTIKVADNGTPVLTDAKTFTVTVREANKQPIIAPIGSQSAPEGNVWSYTIAASDPDVPANTITFSLTTSAPPGVSINPATGVLSWTPTEAQGPGVYELTVQATDNGSPPLTASATFVVTVLAVNDAPSFTRGSDQTALEDAGPQVVNNWATNISRGTPDEAWQTLQFNITTNNDGLFAVLPTINATTGQLTYTPAPNANGTATVTVRLQDNGGTANGGVDTSNPQTFTINFTPVNDAPVGADATATLYEDTPTPLAASMFPFSDAVDAPPHALAALKIVRLPNVGVLTNRGSAVIVGQVIPVADLVANQFVYTPLLNANGVAVASFDFQVQDDGGTANGGVNLDPTPNTLTLTVLPVNDRPSFTRGADQTANEDDAPQTVNNWATNLNAGPADEAAQNLTFMLTTDNDALFATLPTVASDGTLRYTVAPNASGVATVQVVLRDDGGVANGGLDTSTAQFFTITVNGVNDAPLLTPSNPVLPAILMNATGGNGVLVSSMTTGQTDIDAGALQGIAVTNASTPRGTWQFSVTNGATWSNLAAASVTSACLLRGTDRVRFVPHANTLGTVALHYQAWDQSSGIPGGTANVSLAGGTTAFSITADTASLTIRLPLPTIQEDTPRGGNRVTTMVQPFVIDSDPKAKTGIAITSVTGTNFGTWQYDFGGWKPLTPSVAAAVLLRGTERLRFVPFANRTGTATITYHAWDQTFGRVGGTADLTLSTGGATAFSATPVTAQVVVAPVNDAPVLDTSGTVQLTEVRANEANPLGVLLTTLFGSLVIDADNDPIGAAITNVTGRGWWQSSSDGVQWTLLGKPTARTPLYLEANRQLRFVPEPNTVGRATLRYGAWDGQSRSRQSETATLDVLPFVSSAPNNAPVLDNSSSPTLTAAAEDTRPAGTTIAALLGTSVTDADANARRGLAVVGTSDGAHGVWQYSVNDGRTWRPMGDVTPTNALLLNETAQVRFVPIRDWNGTPSFRYHAWDQTRGGTGARANVLAGQGGTGAFSAAEGTAVGHIYAVNDAPLLNPQVRPRLTAIRPNAVNPAGDVLSAPLGVSGRDVDSPRSTWQLELLGKSGQGMWQYQLDGTTSWVPLGNLTPTAAVRLHLQDRVRFIPAPSFQGTATLTYRLSDGSLASSATQTATLAVNDRDDRPVLDVRGTPTLTPVLSNDPNAPGDLVALLLNAATDADPNAQLGLAIVGVNQAHGTWEYSSDDGTTWFAINSPSTQQPFYLAATERLRFRPAIGFVGVTKLRYQAWDSASSDPFGPLARSVAAEVATLMVNNAPQM